MRHPHLPAAWREVIGHTWKPVTAAAVSITGGGLAFAAVEHLSIGIGLYWSLTTAATVGYGDVHPHNAAGRWVASAVMLTAIPSLAAAFAKLASLHIARHLDRKQRPPA